MLEKNIYKILISINFDGHLSIENLFLKVKIHNFLLKYIILASIVIYLYSLIVYGCLTLYIGEME